MVTCKNVRYRLIKVENYFFASESKIFAKFVHLKNKILNNKYAETPNQVINFLTRKQMTSSISSD
jgi:hypothetical protein